jgi:hypothetical protein
MDEISYPRMEILGNTENALGRVQNDAVILELGEEGAEVLFVFLGERLKTRMSSMWAKQKSRP